MAEQIQESNQIFVKIEVMECKVCKTKIEQREVSNYAAYGGLPSPCCKICFEVNDYNIKSIEELQGRSLLRRIQMTEEEKEKLFT